MEKALRSGNLHRIVTTAYRRGRWDVIGETAERLAFSAQSFDPMSEEAATLEVAAMHLADATTFARRGDEASAHHEIDNAARHLLYYREELAGPAVNPPRQSGDRLIRELISQGNLAQAALQSVRHGPQAVDMVAHAVAREVRPGGSNYVDLAWGELVMADSIMRGTVEFFDQTPYMHVDTAAWYLEKAGYGSRASRNPIALTGPAFTFMPFNPFQKFAVDLLGASWRPKGAKKNPRGRRRRNPVDAPIHDTGTVERLKERKKKPPKRDAKWKKPPKTKKISLEEAAKYPGFKEAMERYERFHGTKPDHAEVYLLPDGKKDKRTENVHVALHRTLETPYRVDWESNKQGVIYFHEHPEGEEPLEVLDPATGTTRKIGGSYVVDNWWFS